MKTILYLFCCLIAINILLFPQENSTINPEFYKTWLRYEFYSDIMRGKTPRESMKMQPVMQLFFSQNKNTVLIGSFNEELDRKFKVVTPDTIEIYKQSNNKTPEFTISLFEDNNETKLLVDDGKEKMIFKGLDKKYYDEGKGVNYFINDRLIAGEYVSTEDSTTKVIFTFDGKITGLKNFKKYLIPIFGIGLPLDFDTIILAYRNNGKRKHEVFHWKKSGDKITLYNISKSSDDEMDGGRYLNSKILDKYLELRKIE